MGEALTALIIMDGYGLSTSECVKGNSIKQADTPNLDRYMEEYPFVGLDAAGLSVGLPPGQMGNSEVGHLNIGAGRIVYQEYTRISKSIDDGDFFEKEELLNAIHRVKGNNAQLHLMGLLSDGGVHSHIEHLYALLKMAKLNDLDKVYIHCFLDGRDVPPSSAKEYVQQLEAKIQEIGVGEIATISGRYYAMDRDNRWDRVQKAYDAMVTGEGEIADSGIEAIEQSYELGITDEFVLPTIIQKGGKPVAVINKKDSIVFFNFRPDRSRELTRCFIEEKFDAIKKKNGYLPVFFVTMTQYDKSFENVEIAFKQQVLNNTFGEYISKKGYKQLRIAETEKYAHVTFFFNGGVEALNPGEDRVLIPSPMVPTYDQKPEMSAFEVTKEVIRQIKAQKYDVIILNYANPDMVGHTGVMTAAIDAIETVDKCIGMVVEAIVEVGGRVIITGDHGNAEEMIEIETGELKTAHSLNHVPFILIDEERKNVELRKDAKLADITPTILDLMNIEKPEEMTGISILKK